MRIVLTGGGTGGHIYPAISVGQAMRRMIPGVELLFVGSSHGPEGDIAKQAGFDFRAIPSSPLTKALSIRNGISIIRLFAGVFRAKKVLQEFGPDIVIGTGGYTSAAIVIAQWLRKGPIVIEEQNAVPGKTNLWLSKIAQKVCVTFEKSAEFLPRDKVVVTGLPIRDEFRDLPEKSKAREMLGLDQNKFTIVVVGGSQGARGVNQLMIEAWPILDDGATQVYHQVGKRNYDEIREIDISNAASYRIEAYIDIPVAFAAADLVVGRAGGTIAEITAAGLPSILFPYPYHKDQHQKHNAEFMVEHGAAVMCEELKIDSNYLASIIIDLRNSPEKLAKMAAASKALGKPDAADRVVETALSVLNN